jgi:hypothetical protein
MVGSFPDCCARAASGHAAAALPSSVMNLRRFIRSPRRRRWSTGTAVQFEHSKQSARRERAIGCAMQTGRRPIVERVQQ